MIISSPNNRCIELSSCSNDKYFRRSRGMKRLLVRVETQAVNLLKLTRVTNSFKEYTDEALASENWICNSDKNSSNLPKLYTKHCQDEVFCQHPQPSPVYTGLWIFSVIWGLPVNGILRMFWLLLGTVSLRVQC